MHSSSIIMIQKAYFFNDVSINKIKTFMTLLHCCTAFQNSLSDFFHTWYAENQTGVF